MDMIKNRNNSEVKNRRQLKLNFEHPAMNKADRADDSHYHKVENVKTCN